MCANELVRAICFSLLLGFSVSSAEEPPSSTELPLVGVSPAFSLGVEHPTGQEFAAHLRDVAAHFELPVVTGVDVDILDRKDVGTIL
jgi:hypothetical protein